MAAICFALVAGVSAQQVDRDVRVRSVVADAVRSRLGAGAEVTLDLRLVRLVAGAEPDAAEPEPGVRLARPARFRLLARHQPIGYAVVVLHAALPHLRLARDVAAGHRIEAADLEMVNGDPGAEPIEALPAMEVVAGATARRALHQGEVVTPRVVKIPPAVQSGDRVTVKAIVEGAEATGEAVALQTGELGDVIRLVNPDSRRRLRGVVVGRSAVEVKHES